MGAEKDFNPDKMLGHKFRLASVGIDKFFNKRKEADQDDLPRGQGSLVGYVLHHADEEIYQKDLERIFHITGATASNMLKSLEKSGMIERVPSEHDARLKRIIVTKKAYCREMRIHKNLEILEEALTDGFTEKERAQFFDYMERAVKNIWSLTENAPENCQDRKSHPEK